MSNTQKCENCLQEIEIANTLLHSLYCERNMVKCEKCDLIIDLNQKSDHMQEHIEVACKHCGEMLEEKLQQKHCQYCPNVPTLCEYCELMINKNELVQHQVKCGSRTEQCGVCKKYIPKMQLEAHNLVCQNKTVVVSKPRLKRLQKQISSDEEPSVEEIKQTRRQPTRNRQQQQTAPAVQDDEDEELQKVIQMSMQQK